MRTTSIVLVAGALSLLVAPLEAQVPGDRLTPWAQHRAEFRASVLARTTRLLADWADAMNRQDGVALGRLYTEDAVLLMPHTNLPVAGPAAIVAALRTLRLGSSVAELRIADFLPGDGMAYVLGSFELRSTDGSGAPGVRGLHMAVLERSGSRWRIRSQLFRLESAAVDGRAGAALDVPAG